jgi:hypothetical protein
LLQSSANTLPKPLQSSEEESPDGSESDASVTGIAIGATLGFIALLLGAATVVYFLRHRPAAPILKTSEYSPGDTSDQDTTVDTLARFSAAFLRNTPVIVDVFDSSEEFDTDPPMDSLCEPMRFDSSFMPQSQQP